VRLRQGLRWLALAIVLCAAGYWLAAGANRGWTKTTRERMEKDPITEITFPVRENHFSPGIDVVAGAFFVAGVLAISSLFASRKNNT